MKKGILILVAMFMMVSTIEAKTGNSLSTDFKTEYTYNNAVNFVERGIEFYIFTNGDFDFNTHYNNRGVKISRDYRGRITRIENVFINYDRLGNVTRIGNVFMKYYRNQLTNVGDLKVRYDRYGYPVFYGNVRDYYYDNGVRIHVNFGDVFDYNDTYFFRNEFSINYNQFREDEHFYYYKAKPNAKIGKRSTILKRRKPVANINHRNDIKRNNNNSYRKPNDDKKPEVRIDTRRDSNIHIDRNNSTRKVDNNARNIDTNNTRRSTDIDRSSRTKKEEKKSDTNTRKETTSRKRRGQD